MGSETQDLFAIANRCVSLIKEGRQAEPVAEVRSQRGKDIRDQLRLTAAAIAGEEESLLQARQSASRRIQQWLLAFIGISFVVSATLSLFFIRSLHANLAEIGSKN